jgi:hypothetical protein
MRMRLLLASALTLGAILGPAVDSGAQAPAQDSAVGNAAECLFLDCAARRAHSIVLDVRSGPAGQNPAGRVIWSFSAGSPGSTENGEPDVTCLEITGNVAIIGVAGTARAPARGGVVPVAGLVRVTDGGGPASGLDTFAFALTYGQPGDPPLPGPTECSSFPTGMETFVNELGDLAVTDAQPLPTSKDQCKHGGWAQFGFNNRKQCIRSVRQQARRECIFIRAANGRPAFRAQYGSGIHKRHAMRNCIRDRMNN